MLADALGKLSKNYGGGLRSLSLRGCKQLTDAAVKRVLTSCPRLVSLDLLEIPKLTDQAFRVALPSLEILAVGSLGRPVIAGKRERELSSMAAGQIVTMVGQAAPTVPRNVGPAKFTAGLLEGFEGFESPSFTHLILTRCVDVEAFPRLHPTLRHLDLSYSNIAPPKSLEWKPLSGAPMLRRVMLAGNRILSRIELQAVLASLPPEADLDVLDISNTNADGTLFKALVQMKPFANLSHLRVSECGGMKNLGFFDMLFGFQKLQAFDVSGCRGLESPLVDFTDPRLRNGLVATQPVAAALRLLGIGQTDLAGPKLHTTHRELKKLAPQAEAVTGSLDFFGSHAQMPPELHTTG